MPRALPVTELIARTAVPRAQLPFLAASAAGLGAHVVFLLGFALLKVWPMAAFNVLSVVTFTFVYWCLKTGRLTLGLSVAITEVVVHQALVVYFCGWDLGFQFYLLSVAPLALMLPDVPKKAQLGMASVPILTFIVLALTHGDQPDYPLGDPFGDYIWLVNTVFAFTISWVYILFYQRGTETAEAAVKDAVEQTERLLHSILPPTIVARLRSGEGVVADAFEETTVLFADLVGFTPLAESMTPETLVVLLDEVFASFDDLVAARGLEKIKTIGDAYMVAAGVPEPMTDHADAMADLALAMRDCLAEHAARRQTALAIRIGLHTGPVVAGVIGKTKFAYDLWGDAVNTAARMESHGEPGTVHVSARTAELLDGRFTVEERGVVEVKGKGKMRTFWLRGRASLPGQVSGDPDRRDATTP